MEYTRAFLKSGKWLLKSFRANDDIEASYSGLTSSVVYNSQGKAIHLVQRWQPKTLAKAIAEGATWEDQAYQDAITGKDERARDKLIAGLKLSMK